MTRALWMTAPEAAQTLDVSNDTVRRLVRIGVLDGKLKGDGSYRIKAASVYHYRATQGGAK